MPCQAGIRGITIAGLTEVRVDAIKLPPADGDFVAIRRINGNRRLIRCVTHDVVPLCINIHLITGEDAELRDHARRTLQPVGAQGRRRHAAFL